ncbi:MAG: hypothetical protein A2015_02865 [Spirochaetes bacterium GWF1_31_7]|nr:MAG: hypothetical protein A2Y30_12245 [Spirochaetes bacterium GWE1_32_154]OHD46120.1 MAG: hypothetical protein A2Y29_06955 [Spirochaetes bacterium GWE2_31_10]OHD47518.1 MAG: hypothetical protein A2015_02865 [Spirochaetes bacterium GWF1_31_7]OHD83227.1 MAG: hypothetical protein A2355_12715 [Spirochaetes bacterium RIFOXYB1_FULL_32_8]
MIMIFLILSGLSILFISGVPALFFSSSSEKGHYVTVFLVVLGSITGCIGTAFSFATDIPPTLIISWTIPLGNFAVAVDKLSAFFLIPVFIIPALGSIYSLGYWKQKEHTANGQKLGFFFGTLAGSMALIVIAHDGILFLIAWESMALSAFFCLTTEDHKKEIRDAGFVYFVCTHIGTLILFIMFILWNSTTGSFILTQTQTLSKQTTGIIFIFAFIGFSFKAGFIPFHVWLPDAHANAPSHVSAVMSAVVLKMGIYGIIRFSGLLMVSEPWWGIVLLCVGAITGLSGIVFAFSQTDFKRILAYSSIENIGIIGMGIGLALLGRSYAKPELVILGMGGAFFHVLNHSFFKALLFFNSGAVIHATGTQNIELMGGLAKKMPFSAFMFIIGAVAISALPPLNGFVSEWLLYLGFFKSIEPSTTSNITLIALAAVVLAMIGTLALATFVKMYSIVFLGSPRSEMKNHSHAPALSMKIPMFVLAGFCIITGILPVLVTPLLDGAISAWTAYNPDSLVISKLIPLHFITATGLLLIAIVIIIIVLYKKASTPYKTIKGITWDCGYTKPTPRMQYTGTSFAQIITQLFSFILLPKISKTSQLQHFPEKTHFHYTVADLILSRLVYPVLYFIRKLFFRMYIFQQGQPNLYVLYIIVMVLLLFIFGGIGVDL